MGVFDNLKAAAQAVSDKAKEWVDAGVDKLKDSIDALIAAGPQIEQVGYRLTDLELEASLTPRIVVYLVRDRVVEDSAFAAALEANRESTTVSTLIRGLQQANSLDRRMCPQGRTLSGLRVELGLPPVLSLRYVVAESRHGSAFFADHVEDY